MGFFSNRTINCLNLQLALFALLDQAYFVFSPIYFYSQGFSLVSIFLLMAFPNFLRAPLRVIALPLIFRIGLKASVMLGAAGCGLSFCLLSLSKGWDKWLLLYCVGLAFFSGIHWLAFHTFYSLAGEQEKRGRQVAVAYALATVTTAIAPILGAWFITAYDFQSYFLLAGVLVAFMLGTLSRCQNIPFSPTPWPQAKKLAFNLGAKMHLAESSLGYIFIYCWIFAVYFQVGKITSLGVIIAFGIVVQMVYQFLLGKWMDGGHGIFVAHIAGSTRVLQGLGKALLPLSLPVILGMEALNAVSNVHHCASQPMVLYNDGKKSADTFWYWFFAETAWDIGTVVAGIIASVLLGLGVTVQHIILASIPPVFMTWWLVYRYFKEQKNAA
jgi:hypothetical protein